MVGMKEDATAVLLWGTDVGSRAIDGDQTHCIDDNVVVFG